MAVGDDLDYLLRDVLRGVLGVHCRLAVGRADDSADARSLVAVVEVVFDKHVRGGDGDGAELVERHRSDPELPVALQHEHHGVALLDAERLEVVCRAIGEERDVAVGEARLVLQVVEVDQGDLVRCLGRDGIDGVVGEVVFVGVVELDLLEVALFLDALDEARGVMIRRHHGKRLDRRSLLRFKLRVGIVVGRSAGGDYDREEGAVLLPGNHAVGVGAVVVDRVAGTEKFLVAVDGDLEFSCENVVVFLALVMGELDRRGHLLGGDAGLDDKGFCDLVLEEGCEVVVAETLAPCDGKTAASAGDAVFLQRGGGAFEQIGGVDAQACRALVDEGEGEVGLAGFKFAVFFEGDASTLGHLFLGYLADHAGFAYAICDFF